MRTGASSISTAPSSAAAKAGRFLEGGHPVDAASLLRANMLVTNSGAADDEAASFLAGVLLVRLAEQLRRRDRPGCGQAGIGPRRGSHAWRQTQAAQDGESPRGIVVIGPAADVVNGSSWFSRLLADIRSCGAGIIVAGPSQGPDPIQRAAQAPGPEGAGPEGVEEASGPERASPADGSPDRKNIVY